MIIAIDSIFEKVRLSLEPLLTAASILVLGFFLVVITSGAGFAAYYWIAKGAKLWQSIAYSGLPGCL